MPLGMYWWLLLVVSVRRNFKASFVLIIYLYTWVRWREGSQDARRRVTTCGDNIFLMCSLNGRFIYVLQTREDYKVHVLSVSGHL